MNNGETYHHHKLASGVEFAALEMPGRRITSFQIRMVAGLVDEPENRLGLARIVEETIAKGTEKRSAQGLSDAFDTLGAQTSIAVGRESFVFRCNCLPEYTKEALSLHAEMLRSPIFPEEFCDVAVELGLQELSALEDDPQEMSGRLIARQAYGRLLGRHELGTEESLKGITRDDVVEYWRSQFSASNMQISVGGAVDVDTFTKNVDTLFTGFGDASRPKRDSVQVEFSPGVRHHQKELEQEHILMCWPGTPVTHDEYAVERVMLGVLGGGMSSRLFTEVREKQGLVYWVGAWDEHPRNAGMVFMGASTMPARCDQTAKTLLREVDRLGEDVTQEELDRAKIGIIAKTQTHGDITRARVNELSGDVFHHGRPVSTSEKNEKVMAVTIDDLRHYLANHKRDQLCVQTLGPRALEGVSS
ncbi:MAG: M16 family metallopeptidase [Phycisphaerae bacterium]